MTRVATDPQAGETEPRQVVAVITGQGHKDLVEITVDTDGHPFWAAHRQAWVEDAVFAKEWYRRGEHYAVVAGSVVIADDAVRFGERDMRQALEAKERLEITDEDRIYAAITPHDYFRLYRALTGTTAVATAVASEFRHFYGLEVVEIPTHNPVIRKDHSDVI